MKEKRVKIKYTRIREMKNLKIIAIIDGSYNKLEEKTISVAGRIIFLTNEKEDVVEI